MRTRGNVLMAGLVCACTVVAPVWRSHSWAADKPGPSKTPEAAREAKIEDIKKLVLLNGAADQANALLRQIVEAYKAKYPELGKDFWAGVKIDAQPFELLDSMVLIYDRHFSHDEIQELLRFTLSPLGGKFIKLQPQLTLESMQQTRDWSVQFVKNLDAQRIKTQPQKETPILETGAQ